jgi:P-type conjugative transfer protein TrbJ
VNRRAFLLGGIVALTFTGNAHSQFAVVCTNCSTWMAQLLQYAEQLLQYAAEYSTMRSELQELWQLGNFNFADVVAEITQITNLLNAFSLRAGQISRTVMRLQSEAAEQQLALSMPPSLADQYATWQNAVATSSEGLQNQISNALTSSQNHAALVAQLQQDVSNSQGGLQALQALGEITAQQANELTQLHQSILAYVQTYQTDSAVRAERQAIADQQYANWISAAPFVLGTSKSY